MQYYLQLRLLLEIYNFQALANSLLRHTGIIGPERVLPCQPDLSIILSFRYQFRVNLIL